MDISKATVRQLLAELRGREEVIAVKCWVLKDLYDWIDKEMKSEDSGDDEDEDEDKERAAFIDAHRDEIVGWAKDSLADLEDCTQDDWQMIDSVMYDAVRDVMESYKGEGKA